MPDITSDQLRDISVKTVEMFLNDKIPLSEGLSKQAGIYDLNAEQIQRAVEATNSICYLKIIKVAEDRTVEFPLCKTAEVMAHISVPDFTKSAGVEMEKVASDKPGFEWKSLYVKGYFDEPTLTPNEQFIMLTKLAAENSRFLQEARCDLEVLEYTLQKKASVLERDPLAQAKLSHIGVADLEMVKSAGATEQKTGSFIFKEADLKLAKEVVAMVKRASELRTDIVRREDLQKKAELSKKAFSLNPFNWAGKAIGSVISAPFKMIGRQAVNTAKGAANKVMPGVVSKPTGAGLGRTAKIGGVTAMVGLDATMYQPKPESDIYHQMRHAGPY